MKTHFYSNVNQLETKAFSIETFQFIQKIFMQNLIEMSEKKRKGITFVMPIFVHCRTRTYENLSVMARNEM